jgi:hypothetical protein
LPGKDGLLHISQIAKERVNQVSDYVKEGQIVRVKVLEADDKGRLRLSMKAAAERGRGAGARSVAAPSESTAGGVVDISPTGGKKGRRQAPFFRTGKLLRPAAPRIGYPLGAVHGHGNKSRSLSRGLKLNATLPW